MNVEIAVMCDLAFSSASLVFDVQRQDQFGQKP